MQGTAPGSLLQKNLTRAFAASILFCASLAAQAAYVGVNYLAKFDTADPIRGNQTGLFPDGELIQAADGTFYGVAFSGGATGSGTVFSYRLGMTAPTAFYTFSALVGSPSNSIPTNLDGAAPAAGLLLASNGLLYGTTSQGGANGQGTVFSISTSGTLTTLHTFAATNASSQNADGAASFGKLVEAPDGNLYGTTWMGGSGGSGTLFRISKTGTFTTLYAFPALDANGANSSGAAPHAGLTLSADGGLYGTASGGGANSNGTIFKLTQQGAFSVVHTLSSLNADGVSSLDGATPEAALTQAADGNFYGTTTRFGPGGFGTIFRLTPAGAITTLYAFNSGDLGRATNEPGSDGYDVTGPLLQGSDGTLFGTATQRGPGQGTGTIFGIAPDGSYSILYTFGPPHGVAPSGGLITGSDGLLYGMTSSQLLSNSAADDSLNGAGVIYSAQTLTSPAVTLTVTPTTTYTGPITLTWASSGASGCIGFDQYADETVFLDPSGSMTLDAPSVPGPFVYSVSCQGVFGFANAYAIETILLAAPTVAIAVAPTAIPLGSTATLSWSSTGNGNCNASDGWSGSVNGTGSMSVTPTTMGDVIYTLTCANMTGTASASTTLTVMAAQIPTVTISVSPTEITVGAPPPLLSWIVTNSSSCTASGAWSGGFSGSGSEMLTGLTAGNYAYTLTCTSAAGSATASATLRVQNSSAGGSGGGGGALSPKWLLELLGFLVLRLIWLRRRRREEEQEIQAHLSFQRFDASSRGMLAGESN